MQPFDLLYNTFMERSIFITFCRDYDTPAVITSECYELTNMVWQPRNNGLITARYNHGASVVNNKTIWITGGENDDDWRRLSSTELIHPDGTVTSGPNLPEGRGEHCQASYENTILIIGIFGYCQIKD